MLTSKIILNEKKISFPNDKKRNVTKGIAKITYIKLNKVVSLILERQ